MTDGHLKIAKHLKTCLRHKNVKARSSRDHQSPFPPPGRGSRGRFHLEKLREQRGGSAGVTQLGGRSAQHSKELAQPEPKKWEIG